MKFVIVAKVNKNSYNFWKDFGRVGIGINAGLGFEFLMFILLKTFIFIESRGGILWLSFPIHIFRLVDEKNKKNELFDKFNIETKINQT